MIEETIIRFKFKRPGGIALTDRGRFNPQMTIQYKTLPGVVGRFPYHDYDYNEVFEIKLASEKPRGLPAFMKSADYDDEIRRAYVLEQVKSIQSVHDFNNKLRDELDYYQSTGVIEVVYDSFYASLEAAVEYAKVDDIMSSLNEETEKTEETSTSPSEPKVPKAKAK